jgi:2-amino-4-hydroxy-6-hydroxymethyldihydropteridine diphosphokinase
MVDVVLSLGCNLGDRAAHMRGMERELERILEPPVIKSRLMETEPVAVSGEQVWYFNRLLRAGYAAGPVELLRQCQAIEAKLGRTRPQKFAPRTADIDILLYGEVQIIEQDLTVPHPRLWDRRFCIIGLQEIAADWKMAGCSKRAGELAAEREPMLRDQKIRFVANPASA